jgi:hypothetical protein
MPAASAAGTASASGIRVRPPEPPVAGRAGAEGGAVAGLLIAVFLR